MKKTLNKTTFVNEFKAIRPDNFSIEGLEALFDWFEELENDCSNEIEFDPIAICCDFAEYESAIEAAEEYGFKSDSECVEGALEESLNFLNENTLVIELSNRVIIQGF